MSWTSRLKKAVTKDETRANETNDSSQLDLPPVEMTDATSLSAEQIVDLLREDLVLISENKLTSDEIDPDGHIFDYGYVDSLSAVIFLARLEERFDVMGPVFHEVGDGQDLREQGFDFGLPGFRMDDPGDLFRTSQSFGS